MKSLRCDIYVTCLTPEAYIKKNLNRRSGVLVETLFNNATHNNQQLKKHTFLDVFLSSVTDGMMIVSYLKIFVFHSFHHLLLRSSVSNSIALHMFCSMGYYLLSYIARKHFILYDCHTCMVTKSH